MLARIFAAPWGLPEWAALFAGVNVGWFIGMYLYLLGRAAGARCVGMHVSALGVGEGDPILEARVGGCRVFLRRRVIAGALDFPIPQRWEAPRRHGAILSPCGAAANAAAVGLLIAFAAATPYTWAAIAAGGAAIGNVVYLWRFIPGQGTISCRAAAQAVTPVCDAMGERRSAAHAWDWNAIFWAWFGAPGAAAAALAEADARRDADAGPFERATAALARGAVARTSARLADAASQFEVAAEEFRSAGDRAAGAVSEMLRAEALSAAGRSTTLPAGDGHDEAALDECPALGRVYTKLVELCRLRAGDLTAADGLTRLWSGTGEPAFDTWVGRTAATELANLDPNRSDIAWGYAIAAAHESVERIHHPDELVTVIEAIDQMLLTFRRNVAARGGDPSAETMELLRPIYARSAVTLAGGLKVV